MQNNIHIYNTKRSTALGLGPLHPGGQYGWSGLGEDGSSEGTEQTLSGHHLGLLLLGERRALLVFPGCCLGRQPSVAFHLSLHLHLFSSMTSAPKARSDVFEEGKELHGPPVELRSVSFKVPSTWEVSAVFLTQGTLTSRLRKTQNLLGKEVDLLVVPKEGSPPDTVSRAF